MSEEHHGWYFRGYLPHFDTDEYPQMITFRLGDALPRDVVKKILDDTERGDDERYARFEEMLDSGYGSCVLERDDCAQIVADSLKFHDGDRYRLLEWVIMPNHVHVVYDCPQVSMRKIVHGWKSYTSNAIKKVLGTYGDGEALWQTGFHDRYVRDEQHLVNVEGYIFFNPVRARLVDRPFDWKFSSVHDHQEHREAIQRWWRQWKERFWYADRQW